MAAASAAATAATTTSTPEFGAARALFAEAGWEIRDAGLETWAGVASFTPAAAPSDFTAVRAASARPPPPCPIVILLSVPYDAEAGCPGQLKPNPFGITTSSRPL